MVRTENKKKIVVSNRQFWHFLKLGVIPCKAEQAQLGMELKEKEAQED